VTLGELQPHEWDARLDELGLDDVYLRSSYVETATLLDRGRAAFLHLDGVVFAAIVRDVSDSDARDVTTPYGYGGPIGEPRAAPRFWDAYGRWCAEHNIVTSFFRFHPLYANQRYAAASVLLEPLARTVAWRLGRDDLFAGMHRSHRNKCRKAERAGVVVSAHPEAADLTEFAALYESTMDRVGAAAYYFFEAEYWERLASAVRSHLIRFDAHLEERLVASAVCLGSTAWLHYHLSATTEEARRVGASNLLLYEAARWAKANDFELFHLGGGRGGREDSLLAFKRAFDAEGRREFWIGKAVHDERTYRALTRSVKEGDNGFFPAYRVPGALAQMAGAPDRTHRTRPAIVADVTAR
jgi:hypothetical protein